MKSAILIILVFLVGTAFGIWMVDDTFTPRKHSIAWSYDYRRLDNQGDYGKQRCLYYWYPQEDGHGSYGKRLFCL